MLQDLRQHFVNGKHLKLIQAFISGSWDGMIRMQGHDIGNILEDFQVLDLQLLTFLHFALIALFQLGQFLKDVPFKLNAVKSRHCC